MFRNYSTLKEVLCLAFSVKIAEWKIVIFAIKQLNKCT